MDLLLQFTHSNHESNHQACVQPPIGDKPGSAPPPKKSTRKKKKKKKKKKLKTIIFFLDLIEKPRTKTMIPSNQKVLW